MFAGFANSWVVGPVELAKIRLQTMMFEEEVL